MNRKSKIIVLTITLLTILLVFSGGIALSLMFNNWQIIGYCSLFIFALIFANLEVYIGLFKDTNNEQRKNR